jgi:hypothetical protein
LESIKKGTLMHSADIKSLEINVPTLPRAEPAGDSAPDRYTVSAQYAREALTAAAFCGRLRLPKQRSVTAPLMHSISEHYAPARAT